MSAQQPPASPVDQAFRRLRWLVLGGALVIGVGVGGMVAALRSPSAPAVIGPDSTPPGATWPAGKKIAPGFSLRDQNGQPVSLNQFRGRPVIVTFIDPVCRNLCPLEAKTLDRVVAQMPAAQRPAIIAVSVNQWANARSNLLLDVRKWALPREWHWAVGSPQALARVWKDYEIGVSAQTRTITGIKIHRITHTEAAYLIDPRGFTRALYLYPFKAADVERSLRSLAGA